MSETSNTNPNEKAAKIRRKPEHESTLRPTFAAARHSSSSGLLQRYPSGKGLLQRQCSCGKHTVAGGECEECRQRHGSGLLQRVALDSPGEDEFSDSGVSHILATPSKPIIQANLMVNAPGDLYEQEADQVAEAVMRMPASPPDSISHFLNPSVSRLPSISRLQTSGGGGAFQAPSQVETRLNQMQGGGQPLPETERNFFEQRMGYDFSGVRVHTDTNAVQASREIQARAFTMGNNVAFNEGAYQPGTEAGRRLLAHELTHVVQQGAAGVQRKPILNRSRERSRVLDHLQRLQQQPDFDASLYRKEIAEFQGAHTTGEITTKQQQLLESGPGVDISKRDNSHTLRRKNECTCCVTDVKIQNINRIDNTTHMGHSFDAVISMDYSAGSSGVQSCTLEWWEKTDVPYAASLGQKANTWHDMFAMIPGSPTLAPWVNRKETCKTSQVVTINDPPALGKSPGRTVTRTLEFNIKVKSAAGSSCANQEKAVTAKQVLKMVKATPDWSASSFTTP